MKNASEIGVISRFEKNLGFCPFSPADAYDKNLTYRVGRCSARHWMPRLLPLLQSGKYDLTPVLSHRMPLERGSAAYELFDKKEDGCIKVVLTP